MSNSCVPTVRFALGRLAILVIAAALPMTVVFAGDPAAKPGTTSKNIPKASSDEITKDGGETTKDSDNAMASGRNSAGKFPNTPGYRWKRKPKLLRDVHALKWNEHDSFKQEYTGRVCENRKGELDVYIAYNLRGSKWIVSYAPEMRPERDLINLPYIPAVFDTDGKRLKASTAAASQFNGSLRAEHFVIPLGKRTVCYFGVEEALPETRRNAAIKTLRASILQYQKSLLESGIAQREIRQIEKDIDEQRAELKTLEDEASAKNFRRANSE
jgi:hypothetical protein